MYIMLYYAILLYTMLYYAMLCYATLYCNSNAHTSARSRVLASVDIRCYILLGCGRARARHFGADLCEAHPLIAVWNNYREGPIYIYIYI